VPRDDVAAYMWFSLAAAQGDQDAKQQLDAMNKTIAS
jgi:TPR repeat protein